jgi:hypothetical protein
LDALSAEQERRLAGALREERLIARAAEVSNERVGIKQTNAQLQLAEAERDRAYLALFEKTREIEQLQAELARLKVEHTGLPEEGAAGAAGEDTDGVP